MSFDDSATTDPQLLELLDSFEQALRSGRDTSQIEQEVLTRYGREKMQLLVALKDLHATDPSRLLSDRDATAVLTNEQTNDWPAEKQTLPKRFGRFKILGKIGAGGNGIVLLAFDPQLNREVALKIPRTDASISDDLERRFLREGRAAAALTHPNIIPVFEAGKIADGRFILSAYCAGPNLAIWMLDRCERGQVNHPREVAEWVAQLAEASDYAHRQGVIHRDLKPSNIMLDRDPASSQGAEYAYIPRITDFGIAKLTAADSSVTQTGAILGTPQYMSPEQASGRTKDVDESSDIYALGVILYELLVGRPPILGETILDTLQRVVSDEPQGLRKQRPAIPHELEVICLKCLEKDPAQRYSTAADMAADLRRFLSGDPILARGQGTIRKTVHWVNRWKFSGASVLVGAIAIAGLVFLGTRFTIPREGVSTTAEVAAVNLPANDPGVLREGRYYSDVKHAGAIWSDSYFRVSNQPNTAAAMEELLARYIPQKGESDLRGFEWHYLWKLCHPREFARPPELLLTIDAHASDVYFLRFSPDSRTFATASRDGRARIWDADSGACLFTLEGHTDEVNCVSFSADGSRLATASDDQLVKVWDTATGEAVGTFTGHSTMVVGVAFSPLTTTVVSGDEQGNVKAWDAESFEELRSVQANGQRIESIEYSENGKLVVTGGRDGNVRIWDASDLSMYKLRRYGTPVRSAVFTNGVEYIAYCGDSGDIKFDRIDDGTPWISLVGQQEYTAQTVRIAPGDQTAASVGSKGPIYLWDLPTQSISHVIENDGVSFWGMAFSPDGRRFAAGDQAGRVRVWGVSPEFHRTQLATAPLGLQCMAVSPDSRLLAFGQHTGTRRPPMARGGWQIWDIVADTPRLVHEETGDSIFSLAFSPNGKTLALGGLDRASGEGFVRIVDSQTYDEQSELKLADNLPLQIAILTDNRRMLVASNVWEVDHNSISMWDTVTNRRLDLEPLGHGSLHGEVLQIPISRDGKWVATNSGQTLIFPLGLNYFLQPSRLKTPMGATALEFSPDGQTLALGLKRGEISLWDHLNNQEIEILQGGFSIYRSVKFSPDGNSLAASAFGDTAIRLWSVRHWEALLSLPLPNGFSSYQHLLFSPDGDAIVAAGWNGELGNTGDWRHAVRTEPGSIFLWRIGAEKLGRDARHELPK